MFCRVMTCFVVVLACLASTATARGWQELEKGLYFEEFVSPKKSPVCNYPIVVLKIDPEFYAFKLLSTSEYGTKPKTAREWAEEFRLLAVINAGMYRENYKTSTGYMKNFEHTNNGYVNPKFGAFMAFNPVSSRVPRVQIVDRYHQDWKKLMKQYDTLIQNYRMISLKGENVWKQSKRLYSTACVGIDKDGNVLFIHSRSPFSVHDFNHILIGLPLAIKNAMYVEGGSEASLYVKAGGKEHGWVGSYEISFAKHDDNTLAWGIPNVIGVLRRK